MYPLVLLRDPSICEKSKILVRLYADYVFICISSDLTQSGSSSVSISPSSRSDWIGILKEFTIDSSSNKRFYASDESFLLFNSPSTQMYAHIHLHLHSITTIERAYVKWYQQYGMFVIVSCNYYTITVLYWKYFNKTRFSFIWTFSRTSSRFISIEGSPFLNNNRLSMT